MVEIALKKNQKNQNNPYFCYNCGTEIDNQFLKKCPECNTILNPNDYINWKISWYGFLCCLCIIPILLMLLFITID